MLATEQQQDRAVEFLKCVADRTYFIDTYVQIPLKDDAAPDAPPAAHWGPFRLWPAQREIVAAFDSGLHLIILKARQLGLTTEALACILWQLLFRPACTALLFSRREVEAWDLLDRLKALYAHLPAWFQSCAGDVLTSNNSTWELGNGSVARAFPTTAGDSYTAHIVLCDEFDLVDNQQELLNAVQPTVDAGGQMILLSRVRKEKPATPFKRRYSAAKAGLPGWRAIFLPWRARPDRTDAWYAARVAEALADNGTLDPVHEQYPATDAEALAPPTLNKRLPPAWLLRCYTEGRPTEAPGMPALPGLICYDPPRPNVRYCIGADPAEGNPQSDASAAVVLDRRTRAEVARLTGQIEPTVFARHLTQIRDWYNRAGVLVERNNHGHAVLSHMPAGLIRGPDGRAGWNQTPPNKAGLYDTLADGLRAGDTTIRSLSTFQQLSSIEAATLRAPEGQHDDEAMAYALAYQACALPAASGGQSNYLEGDADAA